MQYFVLAVEPDEAGQTASIGAHPQGLGIEDYEFAKGIPLRKRFKDGASYKFDPEFPNARKLADLQPATLSVFFVSERFKELLKHELKADTVEFLPISLKDHRGKPTNEKYFIANFLGSVDCLDMEKSEYKMNRIHKDRIRRIKRMVIDSKRVPEEAKLFRLASRPSTVVITTDLKEAVQNAKLKGVLCVPVEEFDSAYYLGV